jgi:hypothetical protein
LDFRGRTGIVIWDGQANREIFAPVEAVAMTSEEWEQGDSLIAAFARKGEVLYAA